MQSRLLAIWCMIVAFFGFGGIKARPYRRSYKIRYLNGRRAGSDLHSPGGSRGFRNNMKGGKRR
jgi:hypothetical protein